MGSIIRETKVRVQGMESKYSSFIILLTRRLGLGGPLVLVLAGTCLPDCRFTLLASCLRVASVWVPGVEPAGDSGMDCESNCPPLTNHGGEGRETPHWLHQGYRHLFWSHTSLLNHFQSRCQSLGLKLTGHESSTKYNSNWTAQIQSACPLYNAIKHLE